MDRSRIREALERLETKRPAGADRLRLWFAEVRDLVRLLVPRGSAIDDQLGQYRESWSQRGLEDEESKQASVTSIKRLAAAAREVSALEDASERQAQPVKGGDAEKVTGRLSLRDEFLKVATHPGVVTALVTALFGSLAVALATNWVTRTLGERELQFQVVEEIIEYTKELDPDEVPAISKLGALVKLIGENKQFEVKVAGFQELVEGFWNDELRKTRTGVDELETEKAALERERDHLRAESSESTEGLQALEQDIVKKEAAIRLARERQAEVALLVEEMTEDQQQSESDLEEARGRLVRLQTELERERGRVVRAERALESATRERVVTIETTSEDSAGGYLSIQFSNSEAGLGQNREKGAQEFVVPGREGHHVVSRGVVGEAFLAKRYFVLSNEGSDGWWGSLTLSLDGVRKLSVKVLDADEIESESRAVALSELLSSASPVTLDSRDD